MSDQSANAVKKGEALTLADSKLSAGDFSLSRGVQKPVFEIGAIVTDRYQILALLGEGGMGAVYKAHDRELDRVVALKVIRPELASHPEMLQRFKQELILAREVTHRNVVRIYDIGETDGVKFITMEFVEGDDLGHALREKGKLAPPEAAAIIHQVCAGLQAAHSAGIIHRDLKPGNIMRDKHGRIVLTDFGLAREVESPGMTRTGALVGTLDYMSPEQATGQALDSRSDLYMVGLIFYELLTGKGAYAADSSIASLMKRTRERAKPPTTHDRNIPTALSDICSKCLEIDPKQRYQNANELLADLDAWQRGAGPSAGAIARRWRARFRWWHAAMPALAAVIVLAGLLVPRLRLKPEAQPHPVSVLVADFTNHTGDPVFDGTLEPALNVAMEGASFINAFNRGTARSLARKLPKPADKLDEQPARLVAVAEGISAVITGELSLRGDNYSISATALDAVSGKVLAKAEVTAANKNEVLSAIPKLAAPIRKALGDTTPESVQLEKSSGAFTAASLEAVHQYSVGMEQQFSGKMEEALQSFSKAAQLDPNFARAYSGMAAMAGNLGRQKDAEKYINLAMAHLDRMTERERYRLRGFFYFTTGNWQKCVEEYSELLKRYPVDNVGYQNVAGCYLGLRNLPATVEAARHSVEIAPKSVLQRLNLSFYSTYAGDFQGGEREARTALAQDPTVEYGYVALAEAEVGRGEMAQAAENYRKLAELSPLGTSMAAAGLADLAMYDGRFKDAVRILQQGAAADLKSKQSENAAAKFVALAHLQALREQKSQAIEAAGKALAYGHAAGIRFLTARVLIDIGDLARAQKLAAGLGSELQVEPQAYARILEGESALKRGDARQAIKLISEANSTLDTWIGRFDLGRAYLEAGAFVEADSEFDRCLKRRGEAVELLMDNVPTYGYFPIVYYYQGRVREGLKNASFAESYRTYLNIRGQAGEDPLLPEVRRRAGE